MAEAGGLGIAQGSADAGASCSKAPPPEDPAVAAKMWDKSIGVCLNLKDCAYTFVGGPSGAQACAAALGN